MSDTVLITWNVTNWITVFLMAALGFAILGFVSKAWKTRTGSSEV